MAKDRGGLFKYLSYYVSAYYRVETNQPPQDQFISSVWYLLATRSGGYCIVGHP